MKSIFLGVLFLSTISIGQVDEFKNYTYLKSKGKIPKEFITLTTDKYQEDFKDNKNKDLDKEFFLSTRFFIDEILLSGNVLFNEDLSNYVNKVAKYTLRKEKGLYNKLQFYVLKNNSVNAFSTDQGIIFVTTGLLSQLENEAQLAFIIAHEVAHFTEKHVRDGYVEKQNISKGKGKYRNLSYNDRISELSIYSKESEFSADEKGIEFFLNTEYDIEAVFSSFEVLLYSYLPFEDRQFDSTFFNTEILKIPGKMFPDTVNQITKEEGFDDHLSTHPNIEKRINTAFDVIGNKTSKGNKIYVIGKEEFEKIRDLARFESVNLHLSDREYTETIYNVFLLKSKYKNNKFLDFSLAKALYGLAKYKNHSRVNEVLLKPNKVEGEMYRLAYFLKHLSKQQLNIIAYRNIYDLSVKYKNDALIKRYERDMLKELALNSKINVEDLLATDYQTYNDSIMAMLTKINIDDSIAKIEASDLSKYKKIKLKKELYALDKKRTNTIGSDDFHLTGLSDLVKKGKIITDIEYFIAQKELEDTKVENKEKNKRANAKKGLGIKNVVVIDPYIASYNIKNKKKKINSEQQKVKVNQMFTQDFPKLDLQITLIDSKILNENDVEKYNELGILYRWINEIIEHESIDMISSSNQFIKSITEKYNTEHFLFPGIINFQTRNSFTWVHFYGVLLIYPIPIVVFDLLMIHNQFELFAIAINGETDKIELVKSEYVNLKARNLVMETYLYNILYKLNQPK